MWKRPPDCPANRSTLHNLELKAPLCNRTITTATTRVFDISGPLDMARQTHPPTILRRDRPQSLSTTEAMELTASATSRVFNINELLEIILAQLPTRQLLLLQKVSSTWRALVDRILAFKRKLCTSTPNLGSIFQTDDEIYRLMPLEIKRYGPIAGAKEGESYAIASTFNDLIFERYREGLESRDWQPSTLPQDIYREINMSLHLDDRLRGGETLTVKSHLREFLFDSTQPLSCDDMFLCDPPVRQVMMLCYGPIKPCSLIGQRDFAAVEVVNEGGVRVRDIRQARANPCMWFEVDLLRVRFPAAGAASLQERQPGAPMFLTKEEEGLWKRQVQSRRG